MPIHCPLPIRDLTPLEFDAIDRQVMKQAYAAQNELGRLCDERVYENDLALRLRALGCEVHTQVPVIVSHQGYEKTYRLDLVCDHAVYELKTSAGFAPEHDTQVFHYAMLLSIRHVKLLNFRPPRVEGLLRCNAVSESERHHCRFIVDDWKPLSPRCRELAATMKALVLDWGAFLEARLYEEALIHFCGGEGACVRRTDMKRDGHLLGSHPVAMHSPECFFVVTAMSKDTADYRQHLTRLLKLTGLHGLQWMNFNRHDIEFVTLWVAGE